MLLNRKGIIVVVLAVVVGFVWLPTQGFSQVRPGAKPVMTLEIITSISQVTDVTTTDPHFMALQSLIERYGLEGLTINKKFNGSMPLTGKDFAVINKSVRSVVDQLLVYIESTDAEKKAAFPTTCAIDLKRVTYTEKVVGDYLECSYGRGSLASMKVTTTTLTRSRFAILLDEALSAANYKMSDMDSKAREAILNTKMKAQPGAKKP